MLPRAQFLHSTLVNAGKRNFYACKASTSSRDCLKDMGNGMKCCTTVDKRVWSSPRANRRRRHESSIVFESCRFSKLQLLEFGAYIVATAVAMPSRVLLDSMGTFSAIPSDIVSGDCKRAPMRIAIEAFVSSSSESVKVLDAMVYRRIWQ